MLYFLAFDRSETGKAVRRLKRNIHDLDAARLLQDYRLKHGRFASNGQACVIWDICEKAHPGGIETAHALIDDLWRNARFDVQSQAMRGV